MMKTTVSREEITRENKEVVQLFLHRQNSRNRPCHVKKSQEKTGQTAQRDTCARSPQHALSRKWSMR
jgi:hypothetical protein